MYTLITFATQWGSQHGGINSFNADFLSAFGFAYSHSVQVICIVASADKEAIEKAAKVNVALVPLPFSPQAIAFGSEHGDSGINELARRNIAYEPDKTVWLGHDRITGEAAIAASKSARGRSAVIHHMSYADYEPYAEDSRSAQLKIQAQTKLLQSADIVLAVGPLLRDAAKDRVGAAKSVYMIVPGLAEIASKDAPNTFTAFMSGRLSKDAARIKQGQLGIAAFATAWREARDDRRPEALRQRPRLVLRGIDFEGEVLNLSVGSVEHVESDLKQFAEKYAEAAVNLHALPYTYDRQELYQELSASSVALMPSWHEGFGLVAWEAIAAGVPLILSEQSGVFRLLDEVLLGAGRGCVYPVDISGAESEPFFTEHDLKSIVEMIKEVADDPMRARRQSSILRTLLDDFTWAACAEQAAASFGWEINKGSIPESQVANILTVRETISEPSPLVSESSLLKTPSRQWRPGMGMAASQLLRAEEALLPFDPAREPDVDKLNEWLDDPSFPQAVRLITGSGGQGKTRLALEVCDRREALGWRVGFLDSAIEAVDVSRNWHELYECNQPILIVVDYAETRQESLLALIEAILRKPTAKPIRILLLARDGGEWWDNLPSRNTNCEPLLSSYATTGPYEISPLYPAQADRHNAFRTALQAFARALVVPTPDINPDLAGDHFKRPLYVQIAALLALYGDSATTPEGLTKTLLNHERRYWVRLLEEFNWPEPDRRAEQLLALTTLAGGFARPKDAERYWEEAGRAKIPTSEFGTLFRNLARLYPGTQGLEALRPDLLGEALVAQALLRPQGETLLDAVLSSSPTRIARRNALTVLARLSPYRLDLDQTIIDGLIRHLSQCALDLVTVSKETVSRLPDLTEIAFTHMSSAAKSQAAGVLEPLLAEESVQFARLSCLVHEYLADKSRSRFEKRRNDIDRMVEYAGHLMGYAVSLFFNGRLNEAYEVSSKSMEMYERLVGRNRLRFEDEATRARGNYAQILREIGKGGEAILQSKEVFEIFGRLAAKNADRYEADYARSLSRYSTDLTGAGKHDEALKHDKEALAIRKRLAEKDPDRHEADYATSLGNYASDLTEAGRYDEALRHDEDALAICKRLAENNPDRHEASYAWSLGNYASDLADTGRYDEALKHNQEALAIRKKLAEKNPDRYEPDYAWSLSNYSSGLTKVGRYDEALKHDEEALAIRKRLAEKNPNRYEADYAWSLGNYAIDLTDTGRYDEALKHSQEALAIRKRLAEKNPDRYELDYAWSLSDYSRGLTELGRYDEALKHDEEALAICKRLAENNPDRHEPDYAWSLSNYSNGLTDVGRYDEALKHSAKALTIRRRLAQKNPDRYEHDYALSLSNYSSHLTDTGRYEEALKQSGEALVIRKRLAQKNPDRYEPDYALSLSNYSSDLTDAGRYEEAMKNNEESLAIRERLVTKNPSRFSEYLCLNICLARFLSWLQNQAPDHTKVEVDQRLAFVRSHERPLIMLYSNFAAACLSNDRAIREDNFLSVISDREVLSTGRRRRAHDYWLCAIAWSSQYSATAFRETELRDEWRIFLDQRHGVIPKWMIEAAERLEFEWPRNSE